MPFGEELGSGVGGRTPGMGFSVSDGIRQKFTSKERDIETGLDYFLARFYSSSQGRFVSVDPKEIGLETNTTEVLSYIGNPQNWNRYSYVLSNPLLLTDPDGREPNKSQTATIQQIVAIVEQTERDNPSLKPREILRRVDGYFRALSDEPGKSRYVFTEEKGWIDFRHFFAAANQAATAGEVATDILGLGMEVWQTVTRSTSAFSYEDLPSNGAGSDFGDDHFDPNGGPLSQQVLNYMNTLKPSAPTAAPSYATLPEVQDLGSRAHQSSGSRVPESSTNSAKPGTPKSSGTHAPKSPRSSGSPKAPQAPSSSGNRKKMENR
jgi:RHS repeat-associated protein